MVVVEPVHGYVAGGVFAEPQTPLTSIAADLEAVQLALEPPPVPVHVQDVELPAAGNVGVVAGAVPAEQNAVAAVLGHAVTAEA